MRRKDMMDDDQPAMEETSVEGEETTEFITVSMGQEDESEAWNSDDVGARPRTEMRGG